MIFEWIQALTSYGHQQGLIEEADIIYVLNRLCEKLELDHYEGSYTLLKTPVDHVVVLEKITQYAYEKGLVESPNPPFSDLFDTALMDILMPRPSEVVRNFQKFYEKSPQVATTYYYGLSKSSHYIRMDRVRKNMHWQVSSTYGDIDISVNLSKPEKDPKAIAMGQHQIESGYPKCLLCYENVGYKGHVNHPARQSHRVIPVSLCQEQWYFQYSPYVYFNEHSIVFKKEHAPMKITTKTFERLLDFVDFFPHYFIGSNADLPIVGGSMLTHDHYQSGRTVFPMERAITYESYDLSQYENVSIKWLNWPLTALRLSSQSREDLVACADHITKVWRTYSDAACDIRSMTVETAHNTVTPIARKKGVRYELDIVLRNNRTSQDHPDGIFHPHVSVHPVKKENIGLIEVMGLAVLPSRLKGQMLELGLALENNRSVEQISQDKDLGLFSDLYAHMLKRYGEGKSSADSVHQIVGETFLEGLENCGVYKIDNSGREGMNRFMEALCI